MVAADHSDGGLKREVMMDFDPGEVLVKPLMAYLATGGPEGPRSSPVWFHWELSAIWLIGNDADSFPKRLRVGPRCAVSIVEFDVARGVLRHVGIRGDAEILALDHDRLQRLLARYLGADSADWNPWFRANVITPLNLVIKIAPASVVARSMSYFKTDPDFAD